MLSQATPKSNDNNLLQMLIEWPKLSQKIKKSGIRNRGVWDKLT